MHYVGDVENKNKSFLPQGNSLKKRKTKRVNQIKESKLK
jgi:hypothetical protein